jgi:hypothetical protein
MGHPGKIQGDVGISGEDIGIFGGGTGRSREIQGIHERSERGTGKSMKNTGRDTQRYLEWDVLWRFMELRFKGGTGCLMKDTGRPRVHIERWKSRADTGDLWQVQVEASEIQRNLREVQRIRNKRSIGES